VFFFKLFESLRNFFLLGFLERLGGLISAFSAAVLKISRSSRMLKGFCEVNKIDSRMNFNSMC